MKDFNIVAIKNQVFLFVTIIIAACHDRPEESGFYHHWNFLGIYSELLSAPAVLLTFVMIR